MSFSTPTSPRQRLCRPTLALMATLLWSATCVAQEVWFITDSTRPLQGKRLPTRTIELDAARRIEAELSAGLPRDPQEAQSIVRQRLQAGGPTLQRRLQMAYQGITDAWSLGITSIPAVVVDQRYVVYGEPDVALAVARIERHRRAQP
ncbi:MULTISPECIES: TIGR03757 family integrating conjugative element protein [Comamonadaceae]|uniref:TIGR03757 family integrating conjugative element protein n=2 Tax=Comamonadaceae TaxID=80864 RepID=UPI000570B1E5|nr:TIGR03757 family integrating conjugative element protein [Xenophilus azovorans]